MAEEDASMAIDKGGTLKKKTWQIAQYTRRQSNRLMNRDEATMESGTAVQRR